MHSIRGLPWILLLLPVLAGCSDDGTTDPPDDGALRPGPCLSETFDEVDPTPVSRTRYWYDPSGHPTRREVDRTADIVLDELHEFTYDGEGRLRTERITLLEKSVKVWTYTYEPGAIRGEMDAGPDGTLESITVRTLDAAGRTLEYAEDVGADGDVDLRFLHTYEGDLLVRTDADLDGDGAIDVRESYGYDAEGRRLAIEGDSPPDGNPEYLVAYRYEPGRVTITGETVATQRVFLLRELDYDAAGNLVTERRRQTTGDTTVASTIRHDYSCFGPVGVQTPRFPVALPDGDRDRLLKVLVALR